MAEKQNRGGYGRVPGDWLISQKLSGDDTARITVEAISETTGQPYEKVHRIVRKYAGFLRVKYDLGKGISKITVTPKRLRLLHRILTADYNFKVELRHAEDGRDNSLPSAFAKLLSAARSSGYRGLQDFERRPLEMDMGTLVMYRADIKQNLGL